MPSQDIGGLGQYADVVGCFEPIVAALQVERQLVRVVAARTLHKAVGTLAKGFRAVRKGLRGGSNALWYADYAEIYVPICEIVHNPRSPILAGPMVGVRATINGDASRQPKPKRVEKPSK